MRILVVGKHGPALERRAVCLKTLCPQSEVVTDNDAMSAVKYAFNHAVDALYTEVETRPIDGFDVARLVRKENPGVKVYLLAESDAYLDRAAELRAEGYYLEPTGEDALCWTDLLRGDRPPG